MNSRANECARGATDLTKDNFGLWGPGLDPERQARAFSPHRADIGPWSCLGAPAQRKAETGRYPCSAKRRAARSQGHRVRPVRLLERHPEAAVCAFGPDGLMVAMPRSVPLAGHRVVQARSALNVVIAADRVGMINAWERARAVGASRAPVRLATDPGRPVVLHLIDARRSHGVYLGVVAAAVDDDAMVFDPATPALAPRFSRTGPNMLEATVDILRARDHLLARLVEAVPVGVLQVDTAGHVVSTNDRLHDILGCPPAATFEEQMATVLERDRLRPAGRCDTLLRDGIDDDIDVVVRPRGPTTTTCVGATSACGPHRCRRERHGRRDVRDRRRRELRHARRHAPARRLRHHHPVPQPGVDHRRAQGDTGRSGGRIEPGGHLRRPRPLPGAQRRARTRRRRRIPRCRGPAASRRRARRRRGRTYRGDKFLVICPGIATSMEAVRTATRVADSLGHQIQLKNIRMGSRATIGVAWTSRPGIDAETLVEQADTAMHESKRHGAGGPCCSVRRSSPCTNHRRTTPATTSRHSCSPGAPLGGDGPARDLLLPCVRVLARGRGPRHGIRERHHPRPLARAGRRPGILGRGPHGPWRGRTKWQACRPRWQI